MSENGHTTPTEPKRTFARDVFGLLEDHLELASLEWEYEKAQGIRRIIGLTIGAVAGLCAFIFLQVAIVTVLIRAGMPVWGAAVLLTGLYGVVAVICFKVFGKRPAKAGEPFQGTKTEIRKNLRWIQQFF
jgi:uncharacterized membrane protein YqjE